MVRHLEQEEENKMKQKLIDAMILVIALGIGLIATMANMILSSNGIGKQAKQNFYATCRSASLRSGIALKHHVTK